MCCKCATFPCTYLFALLCKCKKWKEWISMVVVKGLWKSSASLTIITKKIHIPYARSQQGPQTRTLRTLLAPESNGMLSTSDTANGKTTAVLSVDIHRNPHDECILLIKWFSNQMGIWFFFKNCVAQNSWHATSTRCPKRDSIMSYLERQIRSMGQVDEMLMNSLLVQNRFGQHLRSQPA